MMSLTRTREEADELRAQGRALLAQRNIALRTLEAGLVKYGSSRNPLVDVLLDVRNALLLDL